mmetsp:Transcript_944/g.2239  ORF Transcript_944/g.2239 Transcript_944/m.2239 type:complete len:291 (-) Transcript_944:4545-5417(-)
METIDTAQMLRQARAKAAAATFKEIGPSFLFNALQDQLPILVIEVRDIDQYDSLHVRASIRVDKAASAELDSLLNDATRVVVLTQSAGDGLGDAMLEVLKKHSLTKKVFVITGGFDAFNSLYPYMCLDNAASPSAVAFANTRWPSEIMRGVLYMGSAFNLMVPAYIQALGIKTVLQVAPPLSTVTLAEHHYNPIKKSADLVNALALLDAAPKPVLVVDLNGDKESAAVCAVFFAQAKRLSYQAGLTYIMSKRPDASLSSWLSLAVLNYGDEKQDLEVQLLKDQLLRSLTS